MTDKELKRLGRADLLEMLLAQVKENEQMKIRLDEMKAQLDNKQIKIEKAGSLAEATLQLNGVVDAVEAAAAQYLENIQQRSNEEENDASYKMLSSCMRKKGEDEKFFYFNKEV